MTAATHDHATVDRVRFYVTEQIGEKRSTTPEGFLVCHDVPIARTGMQLYSSQEVPIESPNGEVRIDRLPEEVFREETIASFEGKAVTVEHPNEFVTPDNWQRLAVGVVQNVRRGDGIEDDLLIADLVITDQAAIQYVNEKLPEVSAGYEANYEQTEPGRGVQRDIVGNHVALVERGRAGPRCSIQDHEGVNMKAKAEAQKRSFLDRLRTFLDAEEKAEEKEEKKEEAKDSDEEKKDGEEKKPAYDADALESRLARIEAILSKLVPMEEQEHGTSLDQEGGEAQEEGQTGDTVLEAETAGSNPASVGTVLMGDSLKQMTARAEILAPGAAAFRTADAKKAERKEVDAYMKSTLEKAYATADGKEAIEPLLAGRQIKALTGDSLASVFIGAAEIMRAKNNRKVAGAGRAVKTGDFGRASTVADINSRNREFWASRGVAR